jgi:hypothetical protein
MTSLTTEEWDANWEKAEIVMPYGDFCELTDGVGSPSPTDEFSQRPLRQTGKKMQPLESIYYIG